MNKRLILAVPLACCLTVTAPRAQFSVVDFPALGKMIEAAVQMKQMLDFAQQQVRALTNVPQSLIQQFEGLFSSLSNPLGNINLNLSTLLSGAGPGNCGGATDILGQTQMFTAQPPVGGTMDFTGAQLNGRAAQLAGLTACTRTMMDHTQQRISQLPGLIDQLKGCTDVACTSSVTAQLQAMQAEANYETNQTLLIGQNAQLQEMVRNAQAEQKMRRDEEDIIRRTGGAGATGGDGIPLISQRAAPTFNLADFQGGTGG